jgi:hypothetical protein
VREFSKTRCVKISPSKATEGTQETVAVITIIMIRNY